MDDKQAKMIRKARDRALKVAALWRSGVSYNELSRRLNLSRSRVREIVRRGKDLEAMKDAKSAKEKKP